MKTIALISLTLILSCCAHAQLKKGQWMIGGTGDFSHSHTESDMLLGLNREGSSTIYRITPGVGYFFMDRFCGGIGIDIGSIKRMDDQSSVSPFSSFSSHFEETSSVFGLSPFIRYYFLPVARKLNLFADASYSYNNNKTKTKTTVTQENPPNQPSYSKHETSLNTKAMRIRLQRVQ